MNNMITRGLIGVLWIALIAAGTLWSTIGFVTIFGILCGFCLYELITMLQFEKKINILLAVLLSGYILYFYGSKFMAGVSTISNPGIADYLPVLLTGIAFFIIFYNPFEIAYDSSKIIFTAIYVALPFALLTQLVFPHELNNFQTLTVPFLMFVLIWCSDTFAYLVGKFFGRTKLTSISKNKTWEGLIGGMFFTILAGVLIEYYNPDLRGNWIIISILVSIFAPIGDLAESKLKRMFGKKDSSHLIPGHGGFLDRLDSFLLTVPVLYLYFLIYYNI